MKRAGFFALTVYYVFFAPEIYSDEGVTQTLIDYSASTYNDSISIIRTAEETANWKMYSLAIPAYSHVVQSLPEKNAELKTNLTLRKAQIYLLLNQPQEALKTLEPLAFGSGQPHKSSIEALALINLGKPEEATRLLNPQNNSQAILLAMAYEQMGEENKSLQLLNLIPPEDKIFPFSRLLSTKIAIGKGSYQEAYKDLKALKHQLSPSHRLYPEVLWMLGTTQYQLGNTSQSIISFEEALTIPSFQTHHWYSRCIGQLVHVYLSECSAPGRSLEEKKRLLSRAEQMVEEELKRRTSDELTIALAKVILIKNRYFPSEEALSKCKTLLCDSHLLKSKAAQTEALLLQAQIATDYLQREKYLSTLTSQQVGAHANTLPHGWFLRGHNERNEAYEGPPQERRKHLELAASYYQKAYQLFSKSLPSKALFALKSWAQSVHELKDIHQLEKIYGTISALTENVGTTSEIYGIEGLIATHLYDLSGNPKYLDEAIKSLQIGLGQNPSDKDSLELSLLLGKIYFLKNAYEKAESTLSSLIENLTNPTIASEILYWCGRSAELNNHPIHPPQFYYAKCYVDFPLEPYAAEAYFRMYTYQEYLQGNKEAKRHLEEFLVAYPDSRFVMDASFLLGLDSKRDRKSPKGKWISKSNLTKAIDHFQEVCMSFQKFETQNLLDSSNLAHYASLELRSTLEKALCNLAIARSSAGAKKHIYLQYAEEVFTELIGKIEQQNINGLNNDTLEEAMYGLAQTHLEAEHYTQAESIINQIIDRYHSSKVTRGYYLSRSWHDLSLIALADSPNYQQALEYLENAEECAKGRILSTDQTIDLWLKMSHCHRMMGDYDHAMRYLTKAIDEDAISNLRVKAMYLRSEIYELQGRLELSRKQLEATSKKGGEWGQKAKDKLGEIYGYH